MRFLVSWKWFVKKNRLYEMYPIFSVICLSMTWNLYVYMNRLDWIYKKKVNYYIFYIDEQSGWCGHTFKPPYTQKWLLKLKVKNHLWKKKSNLVIYKGGNPLPKFNVGGGPFAPSPFCAFLKRYRVYLLKKKKCVF